MDIKEVLKLKHGTQVKLTNGDNDIWVVSNGISLMQKDNHYPIEGRYSLGFIINANFEKYHEKLTIKEVLRKDMVDHIVKRVGGDEEYKVIEYVDTFDLENLDDGTSINNKYSLSTIFNSLYIDLEECEEDILDEK